MNKHGDPTPPQGPDQNPSELDTDQTLPEGSFDKTLPEGLISPGPVDEGATMVGDDLAPTDDNATMVGDDLAPADDSATMVGDDLAPTDDSATMVGDDLAAADENATMVGFDGSGAAQCSVDVDPEKTLPDGVLAVLSDEDYSTKTIMMDDATLGDGHEPPEEDFGKTLPDGAFDQLAGGSFAEKTMMLDASGMGGSGDPFEDDGTKTLPAGVFGSQVDSGATMVDDGSGSSGQEDDFGKTLQVDGYGQTMATDGTISPEPEFDGKTMVGPDSAVEGEIHANIQTIADPRMKRPGDSVARSRATHTGGRTSIDGTDVIGSETIEGIDKSSLNVAMRGVSGLQYGPIPGSDFKLVKQLGEGGMGVVYVARQQSLGREVVFKTLKPMAETQASKLKASGTINSVIKHKTDMFLSEAVVTADLFHPNIVPIYELAKAPDGSLFYTMKWVRGDGWHKRLKEMTLEENLEVLMKVSDAMGFAHSRNIVNRDLKPENVMLGGYGETIVLDWGLALPFGEGKGRLPIATTAGLGSGTPAYMPPELIKGPLAKIGPACDIYLLGAMLFEVVTGLPPHDFSSRQSAGTMSAGAKLAEVRRVVVENIIRETQHTGELMDIAMKAMASEPEDRYRTVADFQNAIRDYMKHAASHTLADRAKELTTVATPVTTETKPATETPGISYTNYQNALALYNESLREWSGNDAARKGLTEAQKDYAELALTKGDFDLGLSVLDTNAESHSETRSKLLLARQEREGRAKLMKVLKIAAGALVAAVMVLLVVAAKFQIDYREAKRLKEVAVEDTKKAQADLLVADQAKKTAEVAKKSAEELRDAADKQKEEAVKLAAVADKARAMAEMEKAKADKAAADALVAKNDAEKATVKAEADKKEAEVAKKQADIDKAKAENDKKIAEVAERKAAYRAGLADASRVIFEGYYEAAREKLNRLKEEYDEELLGPMGPEWDLLMKTASVLPQSFSLQRPVESIGISGDGRKLVAGYGDPVGSIVVWRIETDGKIRSEQPIRTLALGSRLRAVAMSPDGKNIAASGDGGLISIFSLDAPNNQPPTNLEGHEQPVYSLKFSSDGQRLVSGSDDQTVCLWSVKDGKRLVTSDKMLYPVRCVDWSRNGQWLVVGTSAKDEVSGVAYSWKVEDDKDQLKLVPVRQFQVVAKGNNKKSNDGSGESSEKSDKLNTEGNQKIVQNSGVVAIALTNDGEFAVSNGPAAELHLWKVNPPIKERQKSTIEPKNRFPLKINKDATIRLGVHSNRVERVRSLAFSPDDSQLFVGGDDGTITIWDKSTANNELSLTYVRSKKPVYGHGGSVRGCLPLPNSPDLVIISGSYDQNVHILDVKTYLKTRTEFENPPKKDSDQPAAFRPTDSEVSSLTASDQAETATCDSGNAEDPESQDHSSLPVSSEFVLASLPQSEQDKTQTSSASQDRADPLGEQRRAVRFNAKNEGLGHRDSIYSAVFRRDGKRVISASRDQTARVWNSETGSPVNTVTGLPAVLNNDDDNVLQEGHGLDLFGMRFFPDGKMLLTSGFDGEVRIWDSRIDMEQSFGRELAVLPETSMYGVVDISRDGQWILTAGRRESARRENTSGQKDEKYEAQAQLWNTQDVCVTRRLEPRLKLDNVHRFRVTTVAISPDNSYLLTGDREGRIVIWDAQTGKVVGSPRALHNGEVVMSQFLGDGSRLLTAGVDRRIVLWKVVKTGQQFAFEKISQFDQEGMVVNVAVSPREDRFLSVIRLSDKLTKKANSQGPSTRVSLWTIATGKERVIDVATRDAATRNEGDSDRDRDPFVAWAANGTEAVITVAEGIKNGDVATTAGTLHFFDSEKVAITHSLHVDNSGGKQGADYRAEPFAAIFRPDEPTPLHLLTQTHRVAFLWRLKDGNNIVSFRPQGPVFSAGYSSDGRFIVTGGRSVRIFDGDESKITYARLLHKIEYPHAGIITSVEFSPAEKSFRFLTTSYDGTAKIWEWLPDRKFARQIYELKGHDGPVRFGTWSPDGSKVLTVGYDALPRIWNIADGEVDKPLVLEISSAVAATSTSEETKTDNKSKRDFDQLCAAFSWDGQFVAVGGRDAESDESIGWIWNLAPADGKGPELYATIRGHGLGGINSVAFLPNDDRLLTGGADGTARLWDWQKSAVIANNGKVVEADFLISLVRPNKQPTTHRGPVTSVRVTRTGNMVTASADGTVLIWPK